MAPTSFRKQVQRAEASGRSLHGCEGVEPKGSGSKDNTAWHCTVTCLCQPAIRDKYLSLTAAVNQVRRGGPKS